MSLYCSLFILHIPHTHVILPYHLLSQHNTSLAAVLHYITISHHHHTSPSHHHDSIHHTFLITTSSLSSYHFMHTIKLSLSLISPSYPSPISLISSFITLLFRSILDGPLSSPHPPYLPPFHSAPTASLPQWYVCLTSLDSFR